MNRTSRKPRPLVRDTESIRDDRLFIIACDDTYAPKQYFDFFKIPRIQVHVVPTTDGTSHARHVLRRLKQIEHEEDDERWMVLDTDHCIKGSHLGTFATSLEEAKECGVKLAISRSCFEVWLLLHHVDEAEVASLGNAKEVEAALSKVLTTKYNKRKLDAKHFPLASLVLACNRAERLDQTVGCGDIPEGTSSRVYLLWKAIIAKALRSQLPEELHGMTNDE